MARKKLEKEDTKVVEVSVVEATEEVMEKKKLKNVLQKNLQKLQMKL